LLINNYYIYKPLFDKLILNPENHYYHMIKTNLAIAFIILLLFATCQQKVDNIKIDLTNMDLIKNVPQANWDTLAQKRIYFGHQSVGYNLIDGVKMLLKETPGISLHIKEGNSLTFFEQPVFAHSKNGYNGDPISKIDAFVDIIEGSLGERVDVAGFKFCYVDFNVDTNVGKVFNHYKSQMDKLSSEYPNTTFIHFTVPITIKKTGFKELMKGILKIGNGTSIERNQIRQRFNKLLHEQYDGKNPIFDLAGFESTYPDGKREFTLKRDKKVYSLIPEYSYDGNHLSETGKYWVAGQLLCFLAKL